MKEYLFTGFRMVNTLVDGLLDGLRGNVSNMDENAKRTGTSDPAITFVDGTVVAAGDDDISLDHYVEGGLGLALI